MPFDSTGFELPTKPVKRNKVPLSELADFLEKLPAHNFNMDIWGETNSPKKPTAEHVCGITACIAGWALVLSGRDLRRCREDGNLARRILGLSEEQAEKLFYGGNFSTSPQEAAKVVRVLMETGRVPEGWWGPKPLLWLRWHDRRTPTVQVAARKEV